MKVKRIIYVDSSHCLTNYDLPKRKRLVGFTVEDAAIVLQFNRDTAKRESVVLDKYRNTNVVIV